MLTTFYPNFNSFQATSLFISPENIEKISGFLMFSGGIERD